MLRSIYILKALLTHRECFSVKIIAKFAKILHFNEFQRLMYHRLRPGAVRRPIVILFSVVICFSKTLFKRHPINMSTLQTKLPLRSQIIFIILLILFVQTMMQHFCMVH